MDATVGQPTPTTHAGTHRVLVYTPGIRGYFVDGSRDYIGGREQQYSLLVPRLQSSGLDVHAIVYEAPTEDTGVTYYEIRHPRERRMSYLSFIQDIYGVWRAVEPDVVLQSGAQANTYVLRLMTALSGVPFVFHWASDADRLGLKAPPRHLGPILYRASRASAALNIVQTKQQAAMIKEPAVVIPNVLDVRIDWQSAAGEKVLWLGSIRPVKRPERFIHLARSLPHRQFEMAGGFRGPELFNENIRRQIELTANLTYAGVIPRSQLPSYLASGRCLVNTSDVEGFSNTFLEATASELPVVSVSHDPNDLVQQYDAGIIVSETSLTLAEAVERTYDDATWGRFRSGCRQITRLHDPDPIVADLCEALTAVASRGDHSPIHQVTERRAIRRLME